jgi:hypothetical protein
LFLAERAGDPEQHTDLLRLAPVCMTLTKPIEDLPALCVADAASPLDL